MVAALAVSADLLMGLAGGVSFFFWGRSEHWPDIFLMSACVVAVSGHGVLLLWGKGGEHAKTSVSGNEALSVWKKPLKPRCYPLDWAFSNFIVAGLLYAMAGLASMNMPLCFKGVLAAIASATGWLWPQDRLILKMNVLQFTAILYAIVSLSTLAAGFVANNGFIIAAACLWILTNVILFTVRKENQSKFTQENNLV